MQHKTKNPWEFAAPKGLTKHSYKANVMENNIHKLYMIQDGPNDLEDRINDVSALSDTLDRYVDGLLYEDSERTELHVIKRLTELLLDKLGECQIVVVRN